MLASCAYRNGALIAHAARLTPQFPHLSQHVMPNNDNGACFTKAASIFRYSVFLRGSHRFVAHIFRYSKASSLYFGLFAIRTFFCCHDRTCVARLTNTTMLSSNGLTSATSTDPY